MTAHDTPRVAKRGWAALALTALLAAPAAHAAGKPAQADAHQRYQRESAACMRLASPDIRSNCLSEASTRLAQTLPTPPSESPTVLAENRLKRCAPLPADLRADCEARMHGEGTVSGSVEGGGLYRELVTRDVETEPDTP